MSPTPKQILLIALALASAACTTQGHQEERPGLSTASEPEPDPFRPMLVLPLPSLESKKDVGTPLSTLKGRDADIRDVLLSLFKDSDINLLVDPDVQGTATFDVKGSTVEKAFETLLRTLDLAYQWDGEFLRVRTKKRETFFVDLLGQDPSQGSTTSGAGTQGGSSQGGGTGGGDLDTWDSLQEDLEKITEGQGSLLINPLAGTIEIEAAPSVVDRVRNYLHHTVKRLSRQVSIEARLLEVSLKDEFKLGVEWSLLPGLFNTKNLGTLAGGAMVNQTLRSGASAINVGILKPNEWSVFVDALQKQGQVQILSSPRVSTMNNKPASIRLVRNVPVIERDVIDAGGGPRTEYSVRFVEAGITVMVVPQVGEDGLITVAVNPRIIEITGQVSTPDGALTEPILDTRETTTQVRVADGQTIVLGGLRTSRKIEDTEGVPFLQDVPLLGYLFQKQIQQKEEVELMFTLVPRILDTAWIKEENQRGLDRLFLTARPFRWGPVDMNRDQGVDWRRGFLAGKPGFGDHPGIRITAKPQSTKVQGGKSLTVTREGLAALKAQRARQSWLMGESSNSMSLLEEVAELDPRRVDALVFAALLEIRERKYLEARRNLARALVTDPKNPIVIEAKGSLEFQVGAPEAAVKNLSHAYVLAPNAITANNLAAAMISMGQKKTAKELLEEQSRKPEPPAEIFGNLAFLQIEAKQIDQAKATLDKGLGYGLDRRDPRIRALYRLIQKAEEAKAAEETKAGSQ